ncbi:MAG: hypothetical protein IKR25_08080 [Muribaculaceae bacterium]|nr:hypothetical protein [Muribaculaceae bacterium]
MEEIKKVLEENQRRNALLQAVAYDPVSGKGCAGPRVLHGTQWLPQALLDECPHYDALSPLEQQRCRVRHDFEYWCATCATVIEKTSGRPVPFVLNAPQRRVAAEMERQRLAHMPVRIIMLKARQWGGSTLVQMYMAWMQLVRHKGWNSLICGHLHQTSRSIKGMYSLLLRHYPPHLPTDEDQPLAFRNFEGARDVQVLTGRECQVIVGTAMSEDAVRGYNLAMAHLTEVAFWPNTRKHSPHDVMRAVNGTVGRIEDSVIVLESTANGVGDFFHTEWLRAEAGRSDKTPIFVPWYEIEIYRSPVDDAEKLWAEMDEYEHKLWDNGLTLEMIQWYHDKRPDSLSHASMMAEFPTTATEAFVCSGNAVFALEHLDQLRHNCFAPLMCGDVEGDTRSVRNVHFVPASNGLLKVWKHPKPGERYVAAVDIGGRSDRADYSVIAVLCITDLRNHRPEVVAQWRGHIDHDLLAWKAAQIAELYNHALLIVESNTWESHESKSINGEFLLTMLRGAGVNLYQRDKQHSGFHTDVGNKSQIIHHLISCVRDQRYVEHDSEAVDEMMYYENQPNGGFGARSGHHDDILITRAIALWVVMIDEGYQPPQRTPITSRDKQYLIGEPHQLNLWGDT